MRKLRKIVSGVFSVFGLFAGLAVFLASPVSAESGLISVSSLTPEGGTYTVAWEAKDGCNPALDSSVTKMISDGASGDDLNLGYFTTDENCLYEFTGMYLSAAGAFDVAGEPVPAGVRCAASVYVQHLDGDVATVLSASVSVDTEDCVETSDLIVLVTGPADDDRIDNWHHRSAVNARSWLITVTPNGKGSDGKAETAAAECAEVKGEAADIGRGIPEINFKLVARGLNAADGSARSCQYDVGVTLPDGYVEVVKGAIPKGVIPVKGFAAREIQKEKLEEVVAKSVIPVENFTPVPNAESVIGFVLKVARRKVYVVQNVSGGGGNDSKSAHYKARLACSAGGNQLFLPQIIGSDSPVVQERQLVLLTEGRFNATPSTGTRYASRSLLVPSPIPRPPCCDVSSFEPTIPTLWTPLIEGRFDVTRAVAGSVSTAGGRYVLVADAVDPNGHPCTFHVQVSGGDVRREDVPAGGSEEAVCTVKEDSLKIDLPTAEPHSILEFFFTCLAPVLPTTSLLPAPPTTKAPAGEVLPSSGASGAETVGKGSGTGNGEKASSSPVTSSETPKLEGPEGDTPAG